MKARIFRDVKFPPHGRGFWVLEPEAQEAFRRDPLTGAVSACGPAGPGRMRFSTREEAERYAAARGFSVSLLPDREPEATFASYADNFRPSRRRGWTH